MDIRVSMTGRRYDESGVLPSSLTLPDGAGAADALAALREAAGDLVHDSMLVLVDGRHLGTVGRLRDVPLTDGAQLELLAPVAGG